MPSIVVAAPRPVVAKVSQVLAILLLCSVQGFHQEVAGIGGLVAEAGHVEIVIAVQVTAPGLLITQSEIERRRSGVVVIDAQPYLLMAALAGSFLGGPQKCCSDAARA